MIRMTNKEVIDINVLNFEKHELFSNDNDIIAWKPYTK